MKNQTHPLRTAVAGAVLASAGLTSFSALAAPERPGAAARAEIQQTYRAERAACTDGSSTQARGACLAEAAAVRKEALAGVLGLQTVTRSADAQPTEPDLLANALSRCDAVPSDVRGDCEQRVIGGGGVIVVGSVAEGVIIRELVPVAAPTRVAQAGPGGAGAAAPVAAPSGALPEIVAAPSEPTMEAAPAGTSAAADASVQGLSEGETLVPVQPAQATGLTAEPVDQASPAGDVDAERPIHPAIDAPADPMLAPATAASTTDPSAHPAAEPAVIPAGNSNVIPLPDARVDLLPETRSESEAETPTEPGQEAPALQPENVSEPAAEPVSVAPAGQTDRATPEWQVQQRFE